MQENPFCPRLPIKQIGGWGSLFEKIKLSSVSVYVMWRAVCVNQRCCNISSVSVNVIFMIGSVSVNVIIIIMMPLFKEGNA